MACRRTDEKLLHEPMVTQCTNSGAITGLSEQKHNLSGNKGIHVQLLSIPWAILTIYREIKHTHSRQIVKRLLPLECYFGGQQPKTAMPLIQYWRWLPHPHPLAGLLGTIGRKWMSRLAYWVPCCPIFLVLLKNSTTAPWPIKCVYTLRGGASLKILNVIH